RRRTRRRTRRARPSGRAAPRSRAASPRLASLQYERGPRLDPLVTILGDLRRVQGLRVLRPRPVLRELLRQLGVLAHRVDEHVERHVVLELLADEEVEQRL